MRNLVKIGKFLLLFFVILILFDVAWVAYTYYVCSDAMDNTLENIALVVAEDNCIDESKLDSIKELMVKNAPIWLTYNNAGMGASDPKFSSQPTNLIHTDLNTAKNNITISTASSNSGEFRALQLSDASDAEHLNDSKYYSYTTCPNRGETITITLNAKVNVYLLTLIPGIRQQSIPISKQVTVVGMKFYKGKEES